jgi:hypothetical protein
VTVRDFREAAEQSEKLADKFAEIRALTLFRWKVTGAVMVAAALCGAVVELLYGRRGLWLLVVPTWPAYTQKNRATTWLDAECKIVNDPDKDEILFWKNHA